MPSASGNSRKYRHKLVYVEQLTYAGFLAALVAAGQIPKKMLLS